MPKDDSKLRRLSKFFERKRTNREPPFFFQEVRFATLFASLIFNFARLIFEAIASDVSVILVAARLLFTTLQLFDHWYMCKNWVSFFVDKKIRAYIWFRLFAVMSLYSILYSQQTTFPPYSNTIFIIDGFQWIIGIQGMIWYLWGRKWRCKWGDMSDKKRIPAFVNSMFTGSLLYAILTIYLYVATHTVSRQTTLIASIAYFLVGLIFRYLIVVTNRSTKAITGILDEAISSSIHHHPNLASGGGGAEGLNSSQHSHGNHTPKSSHVRRNSKLMISVRQSLNSHMEISSQQESTIVLPYSTKERNKSDVVRSEVIHEADEEDRGIMKEFDENEVYGDNSDQLIQPSSSLTSTSPYTSLHGNLSTLSHIDIFSTGSNNHHSSHGNSSLNRIHEINTGEITGSGGNGSTNSNNGKDKDLDKDKEDKVENDIDKVRVKPTNTTTNSNGNGSPTGGTILCESTHNQLLLPIPGPIGGSNSLLPPLSLPSRQNSFDMMIDHIPLERQHSLERNLAEYETAHFLSDKVVVVFVQVIIRSFITPHSFFNSNL